MKKDELKDSKSSGKPKNVFLGHTLMVAAGCYDGLIQLSVGFLIMAVINRVIGLNFVLVNIHKTFIIMLYTIVALPIYTSQAEVMRVLRDISSNCLSNRRMDRSPCHYFQKGSV